MANDKTALWDRLGKTDPKHTKSFSRAGGFKGTAIKPMFSFRRMTEEFGPCGIGWGVNTPEFQVVPAGDEVLVYCTVSIWHGNQQQFVYGVGGDKVSGKNKNGTFTDDEAFKKAFTDAVTNALKLIGVGADVHMGLFDDNKYVSALREEMAPQRQNPHVTRPEDIVDGTDQDVLPKPDITVTSLSRAKANPIFKELQDSLWQCGSVADMEAWSVKNKDKISSLPDDYYKIMRGVYVEHKAEIIKLQTGDDTRMAG